MSNLIIDPTQKTIATPKDPYWDAPMSRREVLSAMNQLINNQNALMSYIDTTDIVLNYLMDKLGVKKEDIDKWVQEAAEKLMKQQAVQQANEAHNAQSNV